MSDKPPWRGAKLLIDWRGDRFQQDVADLIGIDLARYNAFENGRARPGLDWAVRIEDVTDSKVPVEAWYTPPPTLAVKPQKRARAS